MATAKKTTVKKTTTPKKRVATKKAPVNKKTTAKKSAAKKSANIASFKVTENVPSFKTFTITRQTVYWVIIVSIIIFFQLWILNLQIEVSNLIEVQRASLEDSL